MAIKFGDTLENQNTDYPIVDGTSNNIKGIIYVSTWSDAQLQGVPATKRAEGTIAVAKDTGALYVYTSSTLTDGTNLWNDADGTAWQEQAGGGSGLLGSPSDGSWTADSPAVSLSNTTTIADAIDLLNETLGALVPTAPKSLAVQIQGADEFSVADFFNFGTQYQNKTTSNADANGISGAPSAGTTVDYITSSSIAEFTVDIAPTNDCAVEGAKLVLEGQTSTLTVNLASGDASDTTSSLTLSKTTGGFPTSGDSANFYTGISSFKYKFLGILDSGYHKLTFSDAGVTQSITKEFWYQPDAANISATSASLNTSTLNEDTNFAYYYSSGIKFLGNTNFSMPISATVNNIVPSGVSLYGAVANSPENYNFAVGVANAPFAAGPTLQYDDHPNVSSNTNVAAGLSAYSMSENVPFGSYSGLYTVGTTHKPKYDFKSMYGDDTGVTFAGTGKTLLIWANRTQSDTNLYPLEDNIYSGINGNGERIGETSSQSYTDNPNGAVGTWGSWSNQYANGSSSLSIDAQDAIVLYTGINHSTGNFTGIDYPSQNAGTNFSSRTTSTAQYSTWKIPLNTSNPVQKIKIKVKGTFSGFWVKQYDTSAGNASLESANSATDGWLDCMSASSSTDANGVTVGGCGDGDSFNGNHSTLKTLTITAGTGGWGNGSHLYVRIKQAQSNQISQLGFFNN